MVQSGQSLTVFLSVARHRTSPPVPLSIASQSVGHLQFSISPLSFSCWENYLPSRQFLARAEHRKVKYFSVFGKRTSSSSAEGQAPREGGESSPECRPCQVEYFSIVCRIHLAKFR